MAARQFWSTLCLFSACWAYAPSQASLNAAILRADIPQLRRTLLEDVRNVLSPDVLRDGACAADIVQHCRHLLPKVRPETRVSHPP